MYIQLFGAAKEVTGSCYSIVTKNERILVDCGMFQGSKEAVKKNFDDFAFDPRKYDAMILTHAHLDHCGRIPKLVKYGFRGNIYCTDATKELAFIIMMDSAKIAAQDTEHENRKRAQQGLPARRPLYNEVDVKNAIKLFKTVDYDKDIKITKNIAVRYYDAGHILGAASIQVEVKEGSKVTVLAFSGDIGQSESIIVKNTEPIKKADYVFIESTYGDRLHPPIDERKKELLRVINDTSSRGGKLMIPSFAVERAQEMLYCIAEFLQDKQIPKMPVYLDSPMAAKATAVFTKFPQYYNDEIRHSLKEREDPFSFPELIITESVDESKAINGVKKPCIIIAGNGMCSAGRIKHHIRNNIEDEKNTLLFIGYQAKGSLGYWIKQKEKVIRLLGTQIKVNSKIEAIDGFSAHADYLELIKWLKYYAPKPKKVFICHGEIEEQKAFSKRLDKEGLKNHIPSEGEKLEL
jgi:metallo-beta-lactamase family protein